MPFFSSLGTFGLSRLAVFIPPVVNPLSNSGSNDAFVVKYNSNGIPLWARRVGGTGSDVTNSVSTDSSGNVIICGNYTTNPVTIFAADGTTVSFTLNNSGSNDVFIVKYDSSGTPLWARRVGGTGSDIAQSVSTDSSGNIIVTGYYSSSPLNIFDANGSTVSFTLTNSGVNDSFVVKYDSSGTPLWARRIGGTASEIANSVSTDSSGNVIICGNYSSNPVTIFAANGTTSFTTLPSANVDAFIVKYDSSGTPLWARRIGGANNDNATSVTTDSSQNIVVCGTFLTTPVNIYNANGTTVITTLSNPSTHTDSFIAKYDSNGTFLWVRQITGTNSDNANSVTTDSSQNIVVCGSFGSTPVSFTGGSGLSLNNSTTAGPTDGFIVKYDSSGTPLWASRIGGAASDIANSVTIDSSGNIIVTGQYLSQPTITIYNSNGNIFTTLSSVSSGDSFVVKYDSSGTALWAKRIAGTGLDIARSVSTDSSGNIIVVGQYATNPVSFS